MFDDDILSEEEINEIDDPKKREQAKKRSRKLKHKSSSYREIYTNVKKIKEDHIKREKKLRMKQFKKGLKTQSYEEEQALKKLAKGSKSSGKVTTEYFFDYNTVEAYLLACAILVCLAGIMYESGRFNDRDDLIYQRDIITVAVFMII